MKKILISLAALTLIFTACGSGNVSKVEKATVKAYEEYAKDNEMHFLLKNRANEEEIKSLEAIYETSSYLNNPPNSYVKYSLYGKSGDYLAGVSIYEYDEEVDEDDLITYACVIDKTVIEYGADSGFKKGDETLEIFTDLCKDLDGEYVEGSLFDFE